MRVHNLLLITMFVWCNDATSAIGDYFFQKFYKISSEIILPSGSPTPSSDVGRSTINASDMRKKAQVSAGVNESSIPAGSTIIISSEDDDVLSRARSNGSSNTRRYDSNKSIVIINPENKSIDGSRLNVEKNLNKSRQYSGSSFFPHEKAGTYVKNGTSVGVMGADGVLLFDCEKTNNTAGRIGDDLVSGSIFNVYINNKALKARCK